MKTMDELFDGSDAHLLCESSETFYPDTVARQWFEDWVRSRAPIAEFTRNANGEYIVLGMHDNYLAFVAGWATRDFADREKNKPAGEARPNAELRGGPAASSPERPA